MFYKVIIFTLFFSSSVYASIFGTDDRTEIKDVTNTIIKEQGRSTPALVRKKNLKKIAGNKYKVVKAGNYVNDLLFCDDERFVKDQQLLANCSAWLIDANTIGTAGHCVMDSDGNMDYHEYYVVFDYVLDEKGRAPKYFDSKKVYEIIDHTYAEFEWDTFKDYALLKLNKPVTDRKFLTLNKGQRVKKGTPLYALGYPFGLALKYQPNGVVITENAEENSFRHHLDTFSVNSGSAIFNAETHEIVGIHVRGTGTNYYKDRQNQCHRWKVGDKARDYGEANYIDVAY